LADDLVRTVGNVALSIIRIQEIQVVSFHLPKYLWKQLMSFLFCKSCYEHIGIGGHLTTVLFNFLLSTPPAVGICERGVILVPLNAGL
jgi:hypothetical protein